MDWKGFLKPCFASIVITLLLAVFVVPYAFAQPSRGLQMKNSQRANLQCSADPIVMSFYQVTVSSGEEKAMNEMMRNEKYAGCNVFAGPLFGGPMFIVGIIVSYLLSCAAVFAYNRMKKKSSTK